MGVPSLRSVAVTLQISVDVMVTPLLGSMETSSIWGSELRTLTVLVDEALPPLGSLTVRVHCKESLGDTIAGVSSSDAPLPRISPVVRLLHSKLSVRVSPSESEELPLQVTVLSAKTLLGEMLTPETVGSLFSTVTTAEASS